MKSKHQDMLKMKLEFHILKITLSTTLVRVNVLTLSLFADLNRLNIVQSCVYTCRWMWCVVNKRWIRRGNNLRRTLLKLTTTPKQVTATQQNEKQKMHRLYFFLLKNFFANLYFSVDFYQLTSLLAQWKITT